MTTPATSEPKSGSVTATAPITSARGQPGQPALLLLLGPPVDQGPGEDLRPGDQRAAGSERAPRQLLGGHHHAHVVGLASGGEPPVLLGDRHPEPAHLGHSGDDLLGDVGVGPVDVLGPRPDLLLGEAVEGLSHQLEVGVEVARSLAGRPGRPGTPGRGRWTRTPRPAPSSRGRRPTARPARWCATPGRRWRRRRRRRRSGPRSRRATRRSAPPRRCARRPRRGPRRRPAPGPRRAHRPRPARPPRSRRPTGPAPPRRRPRPRSGRRTDRRSPARLPKRRRHRASAAGLSPPPPVPASGRQRAGLGHHGDQGWQHHRVVTGIDLGEQLQVVGHRSRAGPGGRLGPGVDGDQTGLAGQRGQQGTDVGVAGRRASRTDHR